MGQFVGGDGAVTITFSGFSGVIKSVDGPDVKRDMIETTHVGVTDGWRTFAAGLKDAGTVQLTIFFDPAQIMPITGAAANLAITFPGPQTWTCSALLQDYKPSVQVGDLAETQVTFKLTGKPSWHP